MTGEFVKAIYSYQLAVYPYCHSQLATILAIAALGLAFLWSWYLFFGKHRNEPLRKPSLTVLSVAHVLVAVNWIFYILCWGEHPVAVLSSLGGIDVLLYIRQIRYGRKARQAVFVLFLVAITVFMSRFVLCDLFPVFLTIQFAY